MILDPTVYGDSPAARVLAVITKDDRRAHEKVARFLIEERQALHAIQRSDLDSYMKDWALQARLKHAEARAKSMQLDNPRARTHLINVITGDVRDMRHANIHNKVVHGAV